MNRRTIRTTKQKDRFWLNTLEQRSMDTDPNWMPEIMERDCRTYRRLKKKLLKKGKK